MMQGASALCFRQRNCEELSVRTPPGRFPVTVSDHGLLSLNKDDFGHIYRRYNSVSIEETGRGRPVRSINKRNINRYTLRHSTMRAAHFVNRHAPCSAGHSAPSSQKIRHMLRSPRLILLKIFRHTARCVHRIYEVLTCSCSFPTDTSDRSSA